MKKSLIFSLIYFLIASLAFADDSHTKVSAKLAAADLAQYQYCGADSDCVIVQNGCCDCANGGEDVAISKRHEKAFKERFDCLQTICTELATIPGCGSGTVSCIQGKCRYNNP